MQAGTYRFPEPEKTFKNVLTILRANRAAAEWLTDKGSNNVEDVPQYKNFVDALEEGIRDVALSGSRLFKKGSIKTKQSWQRVNKWRKVLVVLFVLRYAMCPHEFHANIHTHMHAHIHKYSYSHAPTYTQIFIHTCTHTYIRKYSYTHAHIHANIHTHMHADIYIYFCVRIRETQLHTDIHTYTKIFIHTCTHIHKYSYTHALGCFSSSNNWMVPWIFSF